MNTRGFTFIELLVSMSIFIVITGMMLANFRTGDTQQQLEKSAEVLASRLREAQTRALSAAGGVGVDGYGVYVEADGTTFVSYEDVGTTANAYDSGEETVTTGLLERVTFDNTADIMYQVPSGDMYQNGTIELSDATITLVHLDTGESIDVVANGASGQVTISDSY